MLQQPTGASAGVRRRCSSRLTCSAASSAAYDANMSSRHATAAAMLRRVWQARLPGSGYVAPSSSQPTSSACACRAQAA